jgi:2-aminoadipate transaminase
MLLDLAVITRKPFVWAVARNPGLDTDRLLSAALETAVCMAPSSVFDASG